MLNAHEISGLSASSDTIVVLGAGITGLTAAWQLVRHTPYRIVVLERAPEAGGLASTISANGFRFDTGSHRLHPGCEPAVLQLLTELCGQDLLTRARRGQIYLNGTMLRYPPSALDIFSAFGTHDLILFAVQWMIATGRRSIGNQDHGDFESFIVGRVGRGLYERFYAPYASKLYGLPPSRLSREPAEQRIRKFSAVSILREIFGKTRRGTPFYYYPAGGIGQIAGELTRRIGELGGSVCYVDAVQPFSATSDGLIRSLSFRTAEGKLMTVEPKFVVCTIPLDTIHDLVAPPPGEEKPPFELRWRSLRLVHIRTRDRVTNESETFYFPEPVVPFGRVSEIRKYSPHLNEDPDFTGLTVEFPCSHGDSVWSASARELATDCLSHLRSLGVLCSRGDDNIEVASQNLRTVYPVYELGWKSRFRAVFDRLDRIDNLFMIGRTALFLHCNIDHCMFMATQLSAHLAAGNRTKAEWRPVQKSFFDYRVRE